MRLVVGGIDVFAGTGGRELDPALPLVVFLHGAGLDHTVWALLARWFAHRGSGVLAPDLPVTVRAATQRSLSKNMPFEGWNLRGGVAATIVGGRFVYRNTAVDGLGAWPPAVVQ